MTKKKNCFKNLYTSFIKEQKYFPQGYGTLFAYLYNGLKEYNILGSNYIVLLFDDQNISYFTYTKAVWQVPGFDKKNTFSC